MKNQWIQDRKAMQWKVRRTNIKILGFRQIRNNWRNMSLD